MVLLDEVEKHFYHFVLENFIYCSNCKGFVKEGVDVEEICLTDSNNIKVWGRCRKCNGWVCRLFGFGENKEFYERACRFRESIN